MNTSMGRSLGAVLAGAGLIVMGIRQKRRWSKYLLTLAGGDLARRGIRRYFLGKRAKQRDQHSVDQASEQSFPASDPPAWIAG